MKKIFSFRLLNYSITLVISVGIGWFAGQWLTRLATPTVHFTKAQQFVFHITSIAVESNLAVMQYVDEHTDNVPTPPNIWVSKEKVIKARKKLSAILEKAENIYPQASTQQAIAHYLSWMQHQEWPLIMRIKTRKDKLKWWKERMLARDQLYTALRLAVGFYDIDDSTLASIMLTVPHAETMLKAHPNDAQRCTVMQHYPAPYSDYKLRAQQLAFLRLGEKYCPNYYHQRSAWGVKETKPIAAHAKKSALDKLTYKKYYHDYVLPEAKHLETTTIDWSSLCINQGIATGSRDPKWEAYRVLWLKYHHRYCSTPIPALTSFFSTALSCMQYVRYFCDAGDRGCDIFERCKLTAGVLFDSCRQ